MFAKTTTTTANTTTTTANETEINDPFRDAFQEILKIQGSLIFIFNLPIILMIVSRHKLRQKHSNKFLCSILTVHFLFGCLDLLLSFSSKHIEENIEHNNISLSTQERLELQSKDFLTTAIICLFLNLVVVTMDRLVSIKFPFKYNKLTTKKTFFIIAITWVVSFLYLALSMQFHLRRKSADIITVTLALISFTVLAIANGIIYAVVRNQIKQIKKTTVLADGFKRNKEHRKLQEQKMKSFYLCFGIVFSYVIFWLPHTVNDLINFEMNHKRTNKDIGRATTMFAITNSIADPIIYAIMNRDLKTEFKAITGTFKKKVFSEIDLSERTTSTKF